MRLAQPWLIPGLGLALLWWLLTDGALGAWLVGLPTIALALWLSRPAGLHCSIGGVLQFVPFVVAESVRGGLDVAARTLAPVPRVNPGLADFPIRLRSPQARLLLTYCVSLLPGTLAADLDRDRLRLHLLDVAMDPRIEMQPLERAVGRIFNETLDERKSQA